MYYDSLVLVSDSNDPDDPPIHLAITTSHYSAQRMLKGVVEEKIANHNISFPDHSYSAPILIKDKADWVTAGVFREGHAEPNWDSYATKSLYRILTTNDAENIQLSFWVKVASRHKKLGIWYVDNWVFSSQIIPTYSI